MNDYIRVIGNNTERSSGDILVFDDISKKFDKNYGAYSCLISITSFKGVLIVLIIYFCI